MAKDSYIGANGYVQFLKDFPQYQHRARLQGDPQDDFDYAFGGHAAADNHAEEIAERREQRIERNDITAKQVGFLNSLIANRGDAMHALIDVENLSRYDASTLITELLAKPIVVRRAPVSTVVEIAHAPTLPDVAEGHYALVTEGITKFYRYDRPTEGKWAGYTFLKAQASDDYYPIKNAAEKARILGLIAQDPTAAMRLYGTSLGHCGHCGRTLTDETSRAFGIGPDCREKMGL